MARQRALEHFTVDRTVTAFDEIYTLMGAGYRILPAAGGGDQLATSSTTSRSGKS